MIYIYIYHQPQKSSWNMFPGPTNFRQQQPLGEGVCKDELDVGPYGLGLQGYQDSMSGKKVSLHPT